MSNGKLPASNETASIDDIDENTLTDALIALLDPENNIPISDLQTLIPIFISDEIEETKNDENTSHMPDEDRAVAGPSYFRCDVCNEKFEEKYLLDQHYANHSEGKITSSKNLAKRSQKFQNPEHFEEHSSEQSNSPKYLNKETFKSEEAKIHCKSSTERKFHPRRRSGMHLNRIDNRKNHESMCGLAPEDFQFKCDICNKKFVNKYKLKNHRQIHSNERPYPCEKCGKGFIDSSARNQHQKTCGIDRKDWPYKCEICDKKFPDQYRLKKHRKIHSNERPYPCKTCGKGFIANAERNRHQKMCGIDRKDWPYKCEICNKKFVNKYKLKYHRQIHSNERPYPCKTCGKSFNYRSARWTHQKSCGIDPKDWPYKCEICGQTFTQKWCLDRHYRTHTGGNSS